MSTLANAELTPPKTEVLFFRCNHCHREGFIKPAPHKCNGTFRKDDLDFSVMGGLAADQGAQWKKQIEDAFAEANLAFSHGIRKAIACGALLLDVKDAGKASGLIPHGQFGKWMEKNCPDVPYRTYHRWMELAEGVRKQIGFTQKCHNGTFENVAFHQLLTLPAPELPKAAQKVQHEIFDLVDGKSQTQLLFEFKDPPKKKEYHPPKPMSPAQKVEAEMAMARDNAETILSLVEIHFRQAPTLEKLPSSVRQDILNSFVDISNRIRAMEKGGKGK
jgi:hypothetical protein